MLHRFETWWLLSYPLVFGLGWLSARMDIKQAIKQAQSIPNQVYRGLESLINGKPYDSLIFFSEALHEEQTSEELKSALGTLFRQQGLFHTAIDLHRTILHNENQPETRRHHTQYELANDFLAAGIHNAAEQHFLSLLHTRYRSLALKQLCILYQREKNWSRAITLIEENNPREERPTDLACALSHYYCEKTLQDTHHGSEEFFLSLEKILCIRPECTRAHLLYIQHLAPHDTARIWQHCQAIENEQVSHLQFVLSELALASCSILNNNQNMHYWESLYAKLPSRQVLEELLRQYKKNGTKSLYPLKIIGLSEQYLGTDSLITLLYSSAEPYAKSLIGKLSYTLYAHIRSNQQIYACQKCHYESHQHRWLCPICEEWETFSRKQIL